MQYLSETHQHTLLSIFNLTLALKQKRELEAVIEKLEKVVELYKEAYGPEDPEIEEMRTKLEDWQRDGYSAEPDPNAIDTETNTQALSMVASRIILSGS